ncbi:MAG: hypothetical protein FD175_862 [Beijerinckiaceae bacterium]|nr:MAG: hypothetical protein FD175_862 [Beijerinckiaceae bacterium]
MTRLLSKAVDLACLVRITEGTPLAALRQAIALAAAAGAHLRVFVGVQKLVAPYTPFGGAMTGSIVAEVNQRAEQEAASLAETARAEAGAAGVALEVEIVSGPFAEVAMRAAHAARAADLVVVDQQHGALDTAEMLIEEALFRSGRPVLIVSPNRPPVSEVKRIIVGWDGSAHAVRAVSDALFVFPTIETVEILTISGEKDLASALPAADFARHLARRGLEAVLTSVDAKGRPVAEVLNEYATTRKADLIVSGAFGHSRLWEFLLGGVTVELTSNAKTSVLMSY